MAETVLYECPGCGMLVPGPREWVPVEERPPSPGENVLVWDGEFWHGAYYDDGWWWTMGEGLELGDVTHWMPGPSVPEEKGNDSD